MININPLPPNVYICNRIVKILILIKKEGIIGKSSHERRVYESVDDRSLS